MLKRIPRYSIFYNKALTVMNMYITHNITLTIYSKSTEHKEK